MEEAHCDRTEFLSSYPLNIDEITLIPGSLGRIRSSPVSSDPCPVFQCKMPTQHFKPYLKQHLPKRLHYANNRRIEEVHLLMERKWHIAKKMPEKLRGRCGFNGDHGFDNKITSMRTIFIGHGPSFQFQKQVPEFENIELYNVMCDLLGLSPAPNNGTYGSLNELLREPPFSPEAPQEVTSPTPPLDPEAEAGFDLGCSCDDEIDRNEHLHIYSSLLPFGRPAVLFQTQFSLLHHVEFVSGFSRELRLPLWASFNVPAQVSPDPPPDPPRADPRVAPVHSQSCSFYQQNPTLSHGFLFPPELASSAESRFDASLITNAVPMFPAFKRVWSYLQGVLLRRYAEENNGINVLLGPVFDLNADGLRDTTEKIREYSGDSPPVPSHLFAVECEGDVDVFSFILPNRGDNSEACDSSLPEEQWAEQLLQTHTARVRDVEILTGLDLFRSTNMTQVQALRLKTRLQTFEPDD
uniref:Uncharacterized protein n=1 Tax=Neogobius melanostomus TaxID=47308 RepID=A0A8C6WSH2_9GOBI